MSMVVCSIDERKFEAFQTNLAQIFTTPIQVIRVSDAASLAEGYNRGLERVSGDICIFCHDDITFLNPHTQRIITEDLEQVDMVGVAGTTRLVGGRWIDAGRPYIHGMVGHRMPNEGYVLSIYGSLDSPNMVSNIQALDGLFIAVRREIAASLTFDAQCFDGFHLYDLDYSYNAYKAGFRLAVDSRIQIIHASSGRYDQQWLHYARRFIQKHSAQIHPRQHQQPYFETMFFSSKEALQNAMNHISKGGGAIA